MKNGYITATLTPQNSGSLNVKVIVKKIGSAPKLCCVSGGILQEGVIHWQFVPNGRRPTVDADS